MCFYSFLKFSLLDLGIRLFPIMIALILEDDDSPYTVKHLKMYKGHSSFSYLVRKEWAKILSQSLPL